MARSPRGSGALPVTEVLYAAPEVIRGGKQGRVGVDGHPFPGAQVLPDSRAGRVVRGQVVEVARHDDHQAVQLPRDLGKLGDLPVADDDRRFQVLAGGGQEIAQDSRHYVSPASISPIRVALRAASSQAIWSSGSAASPAASRKRLPSADASPATASAIS